MVLRPKSSPPGSDGDTMVFLATGHWEGFLHGTGALTTICRTQLDLNWQVPPVHVVQ